MNVNYAESWIIASEIVDTLYPIVSLTMQQQEKIASIISDKNNRTWNERDQDWVMSYDDLDDLPTMGEMAATYRGKIE